MLEQLSNGRKILVIDLAGSGKDDKLDLLC